MSRFSDTSGRLSIIAIDIPKNIGTNDLKKLTARIGNAVCAPLRHCSLGALAQLSNGHWAAQAINNLAVGRFHDHEYRSLYRQSASH